MNTHQKYIKTQQNASNCNGCPPECPYVSNCRCLVVKLTGPDMPERYERVPNMFRTCLCGRKLLNYCCFVMWLVCPNATNVPRTCSERHPAGSLWATNSKRWLFWCQALTGAQETTRFSKTTDLFVIFPDFVEFIVCNASTVLDWRYLLRFSWFCHLINTNTQLMTNIARLLLKTIKLPRHL